MFEIILFGLVCLSAAVMLVCRIAFPELAKQEPEPWYLDYARSFFPVLLLVFLLRGFVAEPFRIPSASMYPTLEIGDFLLVNKFSYGLRLPIIHTKVVELGQPKRGDIVVFRYPPDPAQNYIKRLIGLPGDIVTYQNKRLFVNGEEVESEFVGQYSYTTRNGGDLATNQFDQVIAADDDEVATQVKFSTLQLNGLNRLRPRTWKVPEGQYFMMGDNRDNSADSRAWGFVPDENIVGKAFFIWMNLRTDLGGVVDFGRIGTNISAQEVSTGAN